MANLQDWQGRVGDEWADRFEVLDALLGPFGEAGIAALGDVGGLRVLDVGCGSGASCAALAELGAVVTGVDVSQSLIDVARTRDPDFRYSLVLGDAGEVEFARRFDAVFSRFGAMFFDRPVMAFRHLRASARDRARMALVAWTRPGDNDWARLPMEVARAFVEISAPDPAHPGPFAWGDEAVFRGILGDAGWSEVDAEAVEHDVPLGGETGGDPVERAVDFVARVGPLARTVSEMDEAALPRFRAALAERFAPHVADGAVRLTGRAWVITATA